jgi:hypothetical protein
LLTYALFFQVEPHLIKVLIDNGAKLNLVNIQGTPPLVYVLRFYEKKYEALETVIKSLLDKKADPNQMFYLNNIQYSKDKKEFITKEVKDVKLSLFHAFLGLDDKYLPLLEFIVQNTKIEIDYSVKCGIDADLTVLGSILLTLNLQDEKIKNQVKSLIETILALNIEPKPNIDELQFTEQVTCLYWMAGQAKDEKFEDVKFLLGLGADPNTKCNKKTVFQIAAEKGNVKIVEYLVQQYKTPLKKETLETALNKGKTVKINQLIQQAYDKYKPPSEEKNHIELKNN